MRGVLERIIFANEDNHFTIAELKPERGEKVTVCGALPGVQCGETLELGGEWTQHPTHGPQFKIASFESKLPSSVHGIRKYLGSGLIPQIGPKYAEKIVERFGADTLQIISENSGRLREVPGIGKQRAKAIKEAWDEQSALRGVMSFLQQYGVGTSLCLHLIRQYGNEAETILRRDPYRVAREIHGIGFRTADRIALNLGFKTDSLARYEAGLLFALSELEGEGHTGVTGQALQDRAAPLLECAPGDLVAALESLLTKGLLLNQTPPDSSAPPFVQLPATAGSERRIVEAIESLREGRSSLPRIDAARAVEWAQERAGFEFAPQQAEGILQALRHKVSVITGGPGTGKTTILQALVDILVAKRVRLVLAAPTGRAAQRLSESARKPAYTLHRLVLFADGKSQPETPPPHLGKAQFLIVDEASMIDTHLAAQFLQHLSPGTHLLLVGDIHQLPSVGPGQVLADLITLAGKAQPTANL